MILFIAVHVQGHLKESLKGAEVATAILKYVRNNDVAAMEGCDKVCVESIGMYMSICREHRYVQDTMDMCREHRV